MNLEQQIYEKFGQVWYHSGAEYKVTCPTCEKKSLWLNVDKMCFVCFACQPMSSGPLSLLLRIPASVRLRARVESLSQPSSPEKAVRNVTGLPRGYRRVERRGDFPSGWDYVLGRGVGPAAVEFGHYNNTHVCFPMRENGKVVYWQARAISKAIKIKVDNPYNDEDTRGKSTVVYRIDEVKPGEPVLVTEGIFDALRSGGVATLGKKPSRDQLKLLLDRKPSLVAFCYDGDAFDASEAAVALLKSLKRTQPALAVRLPDDKDPADLGRPALLRLVSSALSSDVASLTSLRLAGSDVERTLRLLRD